MSKPTRPRIVGAAVAACALLGPAALAQDDPSAAVYLTHDDADGVIAVGETVTWSLEIGFTGAELASGCNIAIHADNTLGESSPMHIQPFNGGNNGGTSNGAGFDYVNFTNSIFLEAFSGVVADRSNPLLVGEFDFTATRAGTLEYELVNGPASFAFVSIAQTAFAQTDFSSYEVAIITDTLTIVPSPSSLTPLALVGLLANRRRRA